MGSDCLLESHGTTRIFRFWLYLLLLHASSGSVLHTKGDPKGNETSVTKSPQNSRKKKMYYY